jgi:hypothetical protein
LYLCIQELRDLIYEYICVEPDRPIPVGPYYHFREYDQPLQKNIPSLSAKWQRLFVQNFEQLTVKDDVEDDVEEIYVDDETVVLPDGRVKADHSHRPPSDMILPSSHFLSPRYVGPVISYEMQKMYYTRNTFSVCSVEGAISNFLYLHTGWSMKRRTRDGQPPRDLRLEPLFHPCDHVGKLQVRVKHEHFYESIPEESTDSLVYAYEQHFLRFTEYNLRPLKELGTGGSTRPWEIELVLMTALPGSWRGSTDASHRHFINILEAIRDTVYTVMHDCPNSKVKITHYDEGVSIFPRDLTGWFALTKEQWEHVSTIYDYNHGLPLELFWHSRKLAVD